MGQVEGLIVSIIWAVICHNFDMNMKVPLLPQALTVFFYFVFPQVQNLYAISYRKATLLFGKLKFASQYQKTYYSFFKKRKNCGINEKIEKEKKQTAYGNRRPQ